MGDPRGTLWTKEELEWLWIHYGPFKMKFITDHLKRSPLAVRIMACRLRKERHRIEAAEKLRNNSRETRAA